MTIETFLDTLSCCRAIAVMRGRSAGRSASAMEAAVGEGFRLLQFSLDAPGADQLITEFSRRQGLLVGAGDVLDVADLRAAVAAGASFLTSPVCDRRLIAAAQDCGVPLLLGGYSPTEMMQGHQLGATCQLLYPAVPDIAGHVRAVLAALPFLRIVPTDGVHEGNAAEILATGAAGVGFATALFDPAAIEDRRFEVVRRAARSLLASIGHFTYETRRRA